MKLLNFFFMCLLLVCLHLMSSCGKGGHCGGTNGDYIDDARMYAYIDSIYPATSFGNQVKLVELSGMQFFSPYGYKSYPNEEINYSLKFPLPASVDHLDFLIKVNNEIKDTLSIYFDVVPKFYAGDDCNDPQMIPNAVNINIYTRNRVFQVVGYH